MKGINNASPVTLRYSARLRVSGLSLITIAGENKEMEKKRKMEQKSRPEDEREKWRKTSPRI